MKKENKILIKQTSDAYSYLWNIELSNKILPDVFHFDEMQKVIPFNIVQRKIGIDAGCGNGYDLYLMASKHPNIKFIGIDLSEGVYNAKTICKDLLNVHFVRGSLLNLPFKKQSFDFIYSFGVLHHTINPVKSFDELTTALKNNSPFVIYLYENHKDNIIKYYPLKLIKAIRIITIRLPKNLLYFLCVLSSPIIYIAFSLPSKIFSKFRLTRRYVEYIPFNFGKAPFSLAGDLFDRFSAPIEFRYSKKEVLYFFQKDNQFSSIGITKLRNTSGWVAWGIKTVR